MANPVKQSVKRASTSRNDMLRMAATVRAIRIKVSDIPPAKDKVAQQS